MPLLLGGHHLPQGEEACFRECRVIGHVPGHQSGIFVLVKVGDGEEGHQMLDVYPFQAVTDFAYLLHVGDGVVGWLIL